MEPPHDAEQSLQPADRKVMPFDVSQFVGQHNVERFVVRGDHFGGHHDGRTQYADCNR